MNICIFISCKYTSILTTNLWSSYYYYYSQLNKLNIKRLLNFVIGWALYHYIILLTATFLLSLINKRYFWPFLKYKQKYFGHFYGSSAGNKTVPETSGILLCRNITSFPLLISCSLGQARSRHSFTHTPQKRKATFPLSRWKGLEEDMFNCLGKVWTTCLSFYPGNRQPTLTVSSNHQKGVRHNGGEFCEINCLADFRSALLTIHCRKPSLTDMPYFVSFNFKMICESSLLTKFPYSMPFFPFPPCWAQEQSLTAQGRPAWMFCRRPRQPEQGGVNPRGIPGPRRTFTGTRYRSMDWHFAISSIKYL